MKAAMNGGLNLSVLDGWWDEAPYEEAGFVIGEAADEADDELGRGALRGARGAGSAALLRPRRARASVALDREDGVLRVADRAPFLLRPDGDRVPGALLPARGRAAARCDQRATAPARAGRGMTVSHPGARRKPVRPR